MHTFRQSLADFTPAEAMLARAGRIDLHDLAPSFFRFGAEYVEKGRPARIVHGLGEEAPRHALDVEVFDSDQLVGIDQLPRDLVAEVAPLAGNVFVGALETEHGLAAAARPLAASGNAALDASQLGLSAPEPARVGNHLAGAEGRKVFKAHIDTDSRSEFGQQFSFVRHGETNVPATGAAADRDGPDLADELPMPLDLEFADALDIQLAVITDLAAVTVGRERVGVEAVTRLEAREARFLPRFESSEERLERLVEAAQHILAGAEIGRATGAGSTHVFQVSSLIVVVERHAAALVCKTPLLKSGVVEMPGLIDLTIEGLYLSARGVEPELVGFAHLLGPCLLIGDVAFHGCFGNMPDTADIVRPAPKRWHAGAKVAEILTQGTGRKPLELVGNMRWGQRRISLNKEVNVVGHDFKRPNLRVQLVGLFTQERSESVGNCTDQHWQAVFGTPHQVVLERKDCPLVLSVALIDHADNDTQSLSTYQSVNKSAASVGIEPTTTASYPPAA